MVPVNEATEAGQPQLIIRDLPSMSLGGAPPITQPRIYFGERPSDWIITGARQAEFDYPVGETTTDGQLEPGQTTRWSGTTGVKPRHDDVAPPVRAPVPRPQPPDQRPGHGRQPAPVPSLDRRSAAAHRAVPALRQGPVPRRRPTTAGSSTSRTPTRRATGSRTPSGSIRRPCRARAGSATTPSTTSGTASRS